jgi:hypothetical protein
VSSQLSVVPLDRKLIVTFYSSFPKHVLLLSRKCLFILLRVDFLIVVEMVDISESDLMNKVLVGLSTT